MGIQTKVWLEARGRVLTLLRERDVWPESELRGASELRAGLFKEIVAGLLTEGVVEPRSDASGRMQYRMAVPALPPGVVLPGPVTWVAQQVLGWLAEAGRPEGSRRIAQALALPVDEVDAALTELVGLGHVSSRRVGMLVIYRAQEPVQDARPS